MNEFKKEATTRGDPQGLELETSLRLTMGGPSFSSFTVMLCPLGICLRKMTPGKKEEHLGRSPPSKER